MDGEYSEVSTRKRRVVQRAFLELLHKREHPQKEKNDEKIHTLLEFLESGTRRMDNQISKDNGKNCIYHPWNVDCSDI
jgi:hypothetical protein